MSEYQYYEFQAIDRSLTEREIGELRARHALKVSLLERLNRAGVGDEHAST
jgi:hypothetical protein